MAKYSAFGTTLGRGLAQIETATVVGAVTGSGNATVVVTAAGMTGTPITLSVAVLNGDTASTVGRKIKSAAALNVNIAAYFVVSNNGAATIWTRKAAAANDTSMNISIANGSCSGLTSAPTSTNTQAGTVYTTIAQVQNFGGPKLSTDIIDVTAHDSPGSWEESIATILRSGELTMDILYDPVLVTHSYTSTIGLLYEYKERMIVWHKMTFPTTPAASWYFAGIVTGFEMSANYDDALRATVTLKLTGQPIIA